MNEVKAGPIAGILGVFTLLGLSVAFLRPGTESLTQQVDFFLDSIHEASPRERHQNVDQLLHDAETLLADSAFAKLPAAKQKALQDHREELTRYQEYRTRLDQITDPRAARTEEQLREIQSSLHAIQVPIPYQVEWSQSEAGERHRCWLKDVEASARAVNEMTQGYRKLCADADRLREEAEGPNLPRRARSILEEAKKLPTPEKDGSRPIPGSERISYDSVFGFARVEEIYGKWKTERDALSKLEGLEKP